MGQNFQKVESGQIYFSRIQSRGEKVTWSIVYEN